MNISNNETMGDVQLADSEEENLKTNLVIEELRHSLNSLEVFNNSLESKSAIFFGLAAVTLTVMITVLTSIFLNPLNTFSLITQQILFCLFIIVFLVIVRGLFCLVRLIRIKPTIYPFTFDPNEMLNMMEEPYGKFKENLIADYRIVIPSHYKDNINKARLYRNGINSIIVGFFLSFSLIMIIIAAKMFGGI